VVSRWCRHCQDATDHFSDAHPVELRLPDRMYDAVAEWLQVKYGARVDPMDHFPAAWAADAASLLILVRGMLAEQARSTS
jgi:hypothetical protein